MNYYFLQILSGLNEIGQAFVKDLGIWWVLAPIFVLWIVMEIYFGEYQKERLGFSSALANGISLLWINLVSLRIFFLLSDSISDIFLNVNFWIILFFIFYAIFIIYISFNHFMTSNIIDKLASPSVIYFFSVVAVLLSEGSLQISKFVFLDLTFLLIIIYLIFVFIRQFLGVRGEIEIIKELSKKSNV